MVLTANLVAVVGVVTTDVRPVLAAPGPDAFFGPGDVPAEVLIGEDFTFTVRFKNTGTDFGYEPFVDIAMDSRGADGFTATPTAPCDGLTFLGAKMVGVNGTPAPFVIHDGQPGTLPNCNSWATNLDHKWIPSTSNVTVPQGWDLQTIDLGFGSFDDTQPDVVIEVSARVHNFADAGHDLEICIRGGFRGATPSLTAPVLETTKNIVRGNPSWECEPVKPQPAIVTKGASAPEGEAASGPNFQQHYPLMYTVSVDVAKDHVIEGMRLFDILPANAVFVGPASVKVRGSSSPHTAATWAPISACHADPNTYQIAAPAGTSPGGDVVIDLCVPVTGTPEDADVQLTFGFFIPLTDAGGAVILDRGTCRPATVTNRIVVGGTWKPVDLRDSPKDISISDENEILAKCLAIQKKVSDLNGGALVPGDTLLYTLKFQVSDYFIIGDLVVTDHLMDGQLLSEGAPMTLTVTDRFGTTTTSLKSTYDVESTPALTCVEDSITGGQRITYDVSLALASAGGPSLGYLTGGHALSSPSTTPATGEITFQARVTNSFAFRKPGNRNVDKLDPIENCVSITGIVYENSASPLPTAVKASDTSATQEVISVGLFTKSVYARNGKTTDAQDVFGAGDHMTFQLVYDVVPSSDAEKFTIRDWLPMPILDLTYNSGAGVFSTVPTAMLPCSGVPTVNEACYLISSSGLGLSSGLPTVRRDAPSNSLIFNFGTFIDNSNTARKITVRFTVEVTPYPFADGLHFTNEAQECEFNSLARRGCQVAVAEFRVGQPQLQVRKGVVATSKPAALVQYAPTPPSTKTFNVNTGNWSPLGPPITAFNMGTAYDSDIYYVDAGDRVTFVTVVENRGTGPHGAFNVRVKDKLPATVFTPLPGTFSARWGNGANIAGAQTLVAFLGGGITLIDSTSPPPTGTGSLWADQDGPLLPSKDFHSIAIITFTAEIKKNVKGGCYANEVKILHYASSETGPNFAPAFGDPLVDQARVCIVPKLTKSIVRTSEKGTLENLTPRPLTIGEIVRYRLTIAVPEGSHPGFVVTDNLPAGLAFMFDGTARISKTSASVTSVPPNRLPLASLKANQFVPPTYLIPNGAITGVSGPKPANCDNSGQNPIFNLGNVTNSAPNTNAIEYIVIEFNALVCNIPANVDGVQLHNTFKVSTPGSKPSDAVSAVVREPKLKVSKTTNAPAIGVLPGGTVDYTITITNEGTAPAYDVNLSDDLPAELTIQGGVGVAATGGAVCSVNINDVTCTVIPVNDTATVTYTAQATLNREFCGQTLTNGADVSYTSLPQLGTKGNPTGSNTPGTSGKIDGERVYTQTASAGVTLNCSSEGVRLDVVKTVVNQTMAAQVPAGFTFTVNVVCGNLTTNVEFTSAGGTMSVPNLPPGVTCTIDEPNTPPDTANRTACHSGTATWGPPVYPAGQTIVLQPSPAANTLTVQNTWKCVT